jgi:hypothetical protein
LTGEGQVPQSDPGRPHPARINDYYLAGLSHFDADKKAAEAVAAALPAARLAARANRDFIARATRWLASEHGIRQFLDIGSGIPTEPNLHQAVRAVSPDAKVVYSDNDPLVHQLAQALLPSAPEGGTAYVYADVTDPESILDAPCLSDTIDLGHPVALSVNALSHFFGDDQGPYEIVRTLLGALPADSHLLLTHATADFFDPAQAERAAYMLEIYAESGFPMRFRTHSEVSGFFDGLELAAPGLVPPNHWRPSGETAGSSAHTAVTAVPCYAGVARKP